MANIRIDEKQIPNLDGKVALVTGMCIVNPAITFGGPTNMAFKAALQA